MRAIYFFIAFVCMAASFSCSKDNTNVGTPPYMDAKVDGATVQFNTYSAVQNGSNLQINGTSTAANANLAISINNYFSGQVGTYTIGAVPVNFTTATFADPTGGYSAGSSGGSGTVTISFNNGSSIDGTFTFTAINLSAKTKVITEGRFKIYF